MKYLSLMIIAAWSVWVLITHGDVRPSDDPALWILGVLSVMYTIIGTIDAASNIEKRPKRPPLP